LDITFEIDEALAGRLDQEPVGRAIQAALEQFYPDRLPAGASVTLVLTTAEAIRQLNRDYLGIDAPTDVLSFSNEPDPDFPAGETGYLGDIVIAYPVAERQARAAGHTSQEEVILLAVHGALHLAGYDHDTAATRAAMWAAQRQVIDRFGLAHVQPTEE
jgi:probable rRNA maturation factor